MSIRTLLNVKQAFFIYKHALSFSLPSLAAAAGTLWSMVILLLLLLQQERRSKSSLNNKRSRRNRLLEDLAASLGVAERQRCRLLLAKHSNVPAGKEKGEGRVREIIFIFD